MFTASKWGQTPTLENTEWSGSPYQLELRIPGNSYYYARKIPWFLRKSQQHLLNKGCTKYSLKYKEMIRIMPEKSLDLFKEVSATFGKFESL